MNRFASHLSLDWDAAEIAEFSLIAAALLSAAGAACCNFTAAEAVLLGRSAEAWELAGAWLSWFAVLAGTACITFAFVGISRGTKGRRRGRRHGTSPRYVWPEVGAAPKPEVAAVPAARMDEAAQAELAQQLATVESMPSLVTGGGALGTAAPPKPAAGNRVAARATVGQTG